MRDAVKKAMNWTAWRCWFWEHDFIPSEAEPLTLCRWCRRAEPYSPVVGDWSQ
jgi:hypothetical protein